MKDYKVVTFPKTRIATVDIGSIGIQKHQVAALIEIREILHMTILIDHDVIDGSPMARFISDLSGIIENGYGL